jgi:NADH-ubiquinone oxidoreductase chain 3
MTSFLSKKILKTEKKDHHSNVGWTQKDLHDYLSHYGFSLLLWSLINFDVEIALLLPITLLILSSSIKSWIKIRSIFLLILIIGLYHEWSPGALGWANNPASVFMRLSFARHALKPAFSLHLHTNKTASLLNIWCVFASFELEDSCCVQSFLLV